MTDQNVKLLTFALSLQGTLPFCDYEAGEDS